MKSKTKKLIWSAPLVAVLAVAGALAIFMAPAPNEASAQQMELPGMVQDVQVTAYADGVPETQLELTWEAPTNGGSVDSYRIDISMDGDRWMSHVPNHRDSELRLVYSGLESEETRHFRVFAVNRHGTGPGSDDSDATDMSVKPDRPESLEAAAGDGTSTAEIDLNGDGDTDDTVDGVDEATVLLLSQTTIVLTWEPPVESPPGAPITGYEIEYRDHLQASWRDLASVSAGTMTYYDRGLLANTPRYYRVFARNKYGLSTVSDGDSATTGTSEAPAAPTAPVIGLSPRGYDVHLSWTAPSNPPGDPVTHYIVQAREGEGDDDEAWTNVHSGTSIDSTTMYNFGGRDIDNKGGIDLPARNLIPEGGVSVDIRIGAVNNFNRSDAPDWLELVNVPVGHEGAPKKPETPRVRLDQIPNEGRSGLNVTWNTAEFIDAGRPGQTLDDPDTPNDERAFDQTVFNNAVTYILVVDGEEQASAIDHSVALGDGGNDARPGYDDDMLQTETEKTYYVYALNSGVTITTPSDASVRSFPSRTGMGKTARPLRPDAPTDLDVQDSGHTEIDLTWAHASDEDVAGNCDGSDADGSECGGPVITGYKIEISETGTSGWTVLEDEYETQSYTAVNLNPGERYFFRVFAMNSRYTSDHTSEMSAVTTDPGAPTPPGGLVAQADGQDSIKLCWYEQNVVIGGADMDEALPVLGYKITRQAAGGSVETMMENTRNDKTEYTDMGLMAGTAYTYRVHSITLGGTSPAAAAMTMTDPAMVPSMPMSVMAMPTSDTEITVSWMAPADNGGAAITGYMVERGVMGADSMMTWTAVDPAHTGMDRMYMDTGLMPKTTHYYRVSAMNSAGTGAMSDGMTSAMTYRTNVAPMAGAAIDAQTVMADMTVMVQSTITDADPEDSMLTWSAMSDSTMYATAEVDNMGMVTVTGVAAGTATITVTATDDMGESAMQTFMVTVEAADTTLGNAMSLAAMVGTDPGDVTLTWTPGENATIHWIAGVRVVNGAIDPDFTPIWHAASGNGTHTVNAPTAGEYVFAVIAGQTSSGVTEWSRWEIVRYTRP